MAKTVTVTIGRNVGETPMDAEDWSGFTYRTRRAIEGAGVTLFAVAPYKGLWQGVSEDATVYYGQFPDFDVRDTERRVNGLRETLRNLASEYRQDAIGYSVGEGELVESFATEANR